MQKVSLYIPCYNAENFIKECLGSIFRQTYPIDEVLIIDDGSIDRTIEIASRYPVRIIRHEENRGLAAARNTAFKEAKIDELRRDMMSFYREQGYLAGWEEAK